MRAFAILIFALISLITRAVPGYIKGTVHADYRGSDVYLYRIADNLTGARILLASTTVKDSTFRLEYDLEETVQASLETGRVGATIFLEPGREYSLYFPPLPAGIPRLFRNPDRVNVVFLETDTTGTNMLISRFNRMFDEFTERETANIFDKGFLGVLHDFRRQCDSVFSPFANSFVSDYIHFTFADMELNIGIGPRKIYDRYLRGHIMNLSNPAFTDFMARYTEQYICNSAALRRDFTRAVAAGTPLAFTDSVQTHLGSEKPFGELALLYCLYQSWQNGSYSRDQFLVLLENKDGRLTAPATGLAASLNIRLNQLTAGSPAYDFALRGAGGELLRLSSLKKPSLLIFWSADGTESELMLQRLHELARNYSNKVEFVFINTDSSPAIPPRGQQGKFLHYGNDRMVLEKYGVMSLPHLAVTDATGKFVSISLKETELENVLRRLSAD